MKKIFLAILAVVLAVTTMSAQSPLAGDWSGTLNIMGQKLTLVFHISQDASGNWKADMDVPEQGAKGVPATVSSADESSIVVDVPAIGAKYSGKLSDGALKGDFNQMGMKFPLELTKAAVKAANRPQNPVPPFPYTTREVTFVNEKAGATLAGTLTYPIGYEAGKTPVAIMVTGSGAQNRDEEIFDHKPFAVIADYLARHGIATLRYDDRGTGESKGGTDVEATTVDLADDAAAGIDFLRKSGEFGKVGIIGHSEGGLISFILGASNKVDFIVSLAGPATKGETVLISQFRQKIKLSPMAAMVPDLDEAAKMTFDKLVESNKSAWMKAFIEFDPAPYIQATKCPVLALNGSLDSQVLASVNVQPMMEALKENKNAKVVEIEGLNHLFQHCTTGSGEEYYTIEETIAPEVLTLIADFINNIK